MPKNILKAFTKEKTTQIPSLEALLYALDGWFFCGAFCSFLEFDSAWWLYCIPLLHWKGDILQIIVCVCVCVNFSFSGGGSKGDALSARGDLPEEEGTESQQTAKD